MLFHRMILGTMTTNCYIAADENTKAAILFDAPADAERILKYLNEKGLTLKYVFLTHAHFDHVLALSEIIHATGAKLALHKDEAKYLNDSSLNLADIGNVVLPPVKEDILFEDGDKFDFEGIEIKVIHTPGHTEGSVCYLFDETLISGDTLFKQSIGRSDFPLGSFEQEIKNIKEKLMVLDDNISVYPGHGFSTTIGKERRENPYIQYE